MLIVGGVLSAYIPIIKNSMIVWDRLPIFTMGIIVGIQGTNHKMEKAYATKMTVLSIIILTLFGFIKSRLDLSVSFAIFRVFQFVLYIPMTYAFLYILSRIRGKNTILEWVGGLSPEVYLIHITFLHPLAYYGILERAGNWMYIILPLITVMLAGLARLIERRILSMCGA